MDRKFQTPTLDGFIVEEQRKFSSENDKESKLLHRITLSLSRGDQAAWEELYLLMHDVTVRFIDRIIKCREEALDITQDVFVVLWQSTDKINPERNIKGYIYAIARTLAFRHLRQRCKTGGNTSLSDFPEPSIEDISPDDIVMAEETKVLIAMALESMPVQRKRIFELSRTEGLSNEEIARQMELSKRTVEHHLYLAIKELKELLYLAAILLAGI